MTQKSAVLSYFAAKAGNHSKHKFTEQFGIVTTLCTFTPRRVFFRPSRIIPEKYLD
jgi:hypothetical protein